jgi:hypothetical protein
MGTLLADSINYKQASVIKGQYQYFKSYPIEGLNNYPLTNNQGGTSTFNIVPNVINLAKSKLCGMISLPAQGAGNYSYLNINGFKAVQRITVQAQGGPILLETNDIDRYLDITMRKSFSFDDVQGWDAAITATGAPTTFFEGLAPSNFPTAINARLDNSSIAKMGMESLYVMQGATNAVTNWNFKIGFDKFVDTVLAVDHDLYWNSNLTVTIYWNNLARYCWLSTSATNPSTGAAALAVEAGAAISGPYIMLAIQRNELIKREIMEKCMSQNGLSIKIPYIYSQVLSIDAGGNNLQAYYNSGQGSHIKKIWWTCYQRTPATPNLVYDKDNRAFAKISQYQSQLNGVNIQQNPIVPTSGDGYLIERDTLRGSSILSFNEFLYNWSYCENFCEDNYQFLRTLFPEVPEENLIDGLPLLGGQVQYNIISTSVINVTNVLFTVFLRNLRISGEIISLE